MRLPYVIDNRSEETSMKRVLDDLLGLHHGKAVDCASAYFSVRGFSLISAGLAELGSFRLLLGSDPHGGRDLGLRAGGDAIRLESYGDSIVQAHADDLRRELERAPLDAATERLVEDLIRFLREDWVAVRRYARGFLHAKTWLFYADRTRSGQGILLDRFQPLLGIVGSSNFTAPGLTGNNELNLSHRVLLEESDAGDPEAAGMVRYLGEEAASARITDKNRQLIKSEVGARAIAQLVEWYDRVWDESVDYKDAMIQTLVDSKYGPTEYTPWQIYLKALWHYFRDDPAGDDDAPRPTAVELTEFQEDAVRRAQRILARYNGVLIADSVGLGKTWIGKRLLEEWGYFQRQKVLVVAPASLRPMWTRELHEASIAHEILSQERLGQPDFDPFPFGDADIILVDESHNFQNHRSQRYEALEQIIACKGGRGRSGQRKKLILMTATPINNDLFDLYNQISLISQADDGYFATAGIGDLRKYFLAARRATGQDAGINLFTILEEVSVRRPRSFIRENYPEATIDGKLINWPERSLHTEKYSLADVYGRGFYRRIVERIEALQLAPFDLEAYRRDTASLDSWEAGRGQALVGIFKSLYLKRFESSVEAFRISIGRARKFQQAYRDHLREGRLLRPRDWRRLQALTSDGMDAEDGSPAADILDQMEKVSLDEYDVEAIEHAVEADLQILSEIYGKVSDIEAEQDAKYQKLRALLTDLKGNKAIIFTYFKDTSRYLYKCLREDEELLAELGSPNIRVADSECKADEREDIVRRFAPRANKAAGIADTEREINLLVSTDVLAEGRNLQDCQYLINYDLHWAPTRMVQRAGRIDRIGTEFDTLHIYNFFPDAHLDELLRLVETLQNKIEAIDAQGLHDASVLGEIAHPKAFNQIKRIEGEDASVLEDEERAAELASAEGLRVQLQRALQAGHQAMVESLPDGIHSVRHVPKERGVFFCFEAHPDDQDKRRCFWLYYDHRTGSFEDNAYRVAQLIACDPDEPRAETLDSVYDLLPRAVAHVLQSSRRVVAAQEARQRVSPEQTTVATALKQHALQAGISRDRLLAALQCLNLPMHRFAQTRLRRAYQAYAKDSDVCCLMAEVEDLLHGFGVADLGTGDTGQALQESDVHLACFEYVV